MIFKNLTDTKKTNIFVLILILGQFLISFLSVYALGFIPDFYPTTQMAYHLLLFGLPVILYFIITKKPVREVLSLRPLSIRNIITIILISFTMQPVLSVFSFLSSLVFKNNIASALMEMQDVSVGWIIVSMAVFPAVLEEICYRGIVLYGYRNLNPLKACLMSGFLFGIMHFSAQQFLYAFFFGVILGYFVYKTKSIFASIVSHFTINASQILFSRVLSGLSLSEGYSSATDMAGTEVFSTLFYLISAVVFTAPFLLLFFWYFERINRDNGFLSDWNYQAGKPREKMFDAAIWVVILIYIAIAIVPEFYNYLA
ncbi:MAG: type II CAAX endopeptidase family protein [Lachnospiraceae bacterium]|nr:type II CAAX endopeptidase family protein [Lachnospiraceae bacterium]